jgi:dolichyl-phosphate beta-glucosyltransferase
VTALIYRRWAGRVFSWLTAVAGLAGIADSQCGFKCFRGEAAADLFQRLQTPGFAFDFEVLLRARRHGYTIVEVPVNWADQPGSKVLVLRDGPRMTWEVLRARWKLAVEWPPSPDAN